MCPHILHKRLVALPSGLIQFRDSVAVLSRGGGGLLRRLLEPSMQVDRATARPAGVPEVKWAEPSPRICPFGNGLQRQLGPAGGADLASPAQPLARCSFKWRCH